MVESLQVTGPHRGALERDETSALQDAIDDRGSEIAVVQHGTPVDERLVSGEHDRAELDVAFVDDVEEQVGGRVAVAEIA